MPSSWKHFTRVAFGGGTTEERSTAWRHPVGSSRAVGSPSPPQLEVENCDFKFVAYRIEGYAMTELARQSIAPDTIGRKILQRRLSAYGRIVAAFLASYLVVFNYINILNPAYAWRDLIWNGSNLLHAAAAVVMILVWLGCRTVDRPMSVLRALDSVGFLMVARSVLVPSSGQRTIALCAALVPFATLAAWDFDVRRGLPTVDVIRHSVETFVSCSIAVGTATVACQVIFGLRAKVYFLLSGANAFEADTVEKIFEGHLTLKPTPLVERTSGTIPPELDALVLACLAKDPADRPASAKALRGLLRECKGVDRWTQKEARKWWTTYWASNPAAPAVQRAANDASGTSQLDVDFKGREVPSQQSPPPPRRRTPRA